MTNGNNDGSGKGPQKPADGGKKPSALIDLKATEIKGSEKPASASGSKPAEASGGKPIETGTKASPAAVEIKSADPSSSAAKPTDKPATPKAADTTLKMGSGPSPQPKAAVQPGTTTQRSGGGIASVASHLFAGIAGGFLALLGADTIGQQLGLPIANTSINDIQRRIAAVEEAAKAKPAAPAPEVAQKLAAAEARLARIEETSKALPALTEAQAKTSAENKALAEKFAKPAPGADAEKLARLEETLATLSTAAANDPQKGRIPQLAQITGKIADLEASLGGQMAAARKSIAQDVEARLGQATEAAEQARAGVQRIDRDLAAVKSESARNSQRMDNLDQALKTANADTAAIKGSVDALKGDVANLGKSVARPQDVSTALSPLSAKIASVEQSLAGVVKSEDDRKANAERIVLSLELANLRRALDRGGAFAPELAAVQKTTAAAKFDLKPLDALKDKGVPTTSALSTEFRSAAYAIINADAAPAEEGTVVDKLLSGAKSIVRIRKTSASATDNSAEAIASRMDTALKANRLADISEEAKKLSPKARAAAASWLASVEARAAVDRTLAEIETQLKASISGKPTP